MSHHGYPITSAKLANGDSVFRNDHIYVSPPWSERDGTPYMIARIIEFLPPNATPKKGSKNSHSNEIHVRISLYYRLSDISGRSVADFRLLLAAIHTDIQPLSNIRGKCYVRHKDRIEDVIAWKKQPDRFYFVRFFDPYIKREFEVIRTESVNNIPKNVKETLMNRYEYLVTEKEMVSDLTDNYRSCCICTEWASSQDSVKCEACRKHYHMSCLNPPLLAKPAKGYSWICVPCGLQRRKDVQDQKFHFGQSSTAAGGPGSGKGKGGGGGHGKEKKDKTVTGGRMDVMHRGWPWRYFGQYTKAEDTLDPDDLIFPRAATRVGQKFQANVPTWEEQQAMENQHGPGHSGEGEAGPSSRHITVERGHDIGERKHESTIDIWCTPKDDLPLYMEQVSLLRLPVPAYDVERLNKAASYYTSLGVEGALNRMRTLKYEDFNPVVFSEKETVVFESELEHQGGLDTHETAKLLKRKPAEVLRFSYIWKNRKLKIENEALRAHHKISGNMVGAHARKNQTLGAPSLGRIRARAGTEENVGDDKSIFGDDEVKIQGNKMQCVACSTKVSNVWWKCPRSVQGVAMCESCGANYRKYGVIQFVKNDDVAKKPEKKDLLSTTKRGKGEGSGASTPQPQAPPKLPPCACCRKMEPKSGMARCKTCTFSVHSGCYGIAPQDMGPSWECELCLNDKVEDNNLQPQCVLCPKDNSSLTTKLKSKKQTYDFDLLSAMKPTEGRRWAHILCSAWIPEIIYTDPVTLKTVEGIATIPVDRWATICTLCNQLDGAVIHCADCDIAFHPSCAWLSGYKFGFEFSLAKPGKREVVTIAKFKDGMGVMNPGCWCKGHDLEGRIIYEMQEIDPEQNETALQIYSSSYKTLPSQDETFALLRKARRLDTFAVNQPSEAEETICAECEIDVSPKWHPKPTEALSADSIKQDANGDYDMLDEDAKDMQEKDVDLEKVHQDPKGKMLCHQCWFRMNS